MMTAVDCPEGECFKINLAQNPYCHYLCDCLFGLLMIPHADVHILQKCMLKSFPVHRGLNRSYSSGLF